MILIKTIIFITNIPFLLSQIYYVSSQIPCGSICDGSLSFPFPDIQTTLLSLNNLLPFNVTTLILMDGVYTGPNNSNINIQDLKIIIKSLNGPY